MFTRKGETNFSEVGLQGQGHRGQLKAGQFSNEHKRECFWQPLVNEALIVFTQLLVKRP